MKKNINLPEKDYYSVEEIIEEWGCSVSDIYHYAFTDILKLAVIVSDLRVYAIAELPYTEDTTSRRCIGICTVTGVLYPRPINYKRCLIMNSDECSTFLFLKPSSCYLTIYPMIVAGLMDKKVHKRTQEDLLGGINQPVAPIDHDKFTLLQDKDADLITEFEYASNEGEDTCYTFNKGQLVVTKEEKTRFENLCSELSYQHTQISEKQLNNQNKTIGILVKLLIESKGLKYKLGTIQAPNVRQISEAIINYIDTNDHEKTGMSLRAIQGRISNALKSI